MREDEMDRFVKRAAQPLQTSGSVPDEIAQAITALGAIRQISAARAHLDALIMAAIGKPSADAFAYAVWMVGNMDTAEDKAAWWSEFQEVWEAAGRRVEALHAQGVMVEGRLPRSRITPSSRICEAAMNTQQIVALARKCGFYHLVNCSRTNLGCTEPALQTFAAAIAEECAKIGDQAWWDNNNPATAIRRAFPAPETKP